MTEFLLPEATIAEMSRAMGAGALTAEQLVRMYLERIAAYDRAGVTLNSVLEINPDALHIAEALDRERKLSGPRGPLHGIPVMIKDNIDTADKLHTSAGSLALASSYAPRDAAVAERLRRAGAVILGKVNMTEWANFMTIGMPSGYSSRGGQVLNPYLPGKLTPSGSSAGSGVAVAANLCAVAIGTETSGSILSPSNNNSVVGIKPTVGLISRTGIIPIAFSQDTAGPMARTVADAATLLGALVGVDPADPATAVSAGRAYRDYTRFLDKGGLRGARIGVPRGPWVERLDADEQRLFDEAVRAIRAAGAEVVDPADLKYMKYWDSNVLVYEFKPALNRYLASLGPAAPVRSLKEIVAFNEENPEAMLRYGQKLMAQAEATSGTLTEPEYLLDRLRDLRQTRSEGIDATLEEHRLDALLFPGTWGCWIPARAGYPSIQVPAGYTGDGRPFGITLTGPAWSEPTLIRLGYAYEQATLLRRPPQLEQAAVAPQEPPPAEDED
ncbi:MAG: amidase [Bacillota bacterium]